MALPTNTTRCVICATPLKKNGKTPAGKQRWRCPACGASTTRTRPDVTDRESLYRFVSWLTGKMTQAEAAGSSTGRTFRRRIASCWGLTPVLPRVEDVFHAVLVDGIWIGSWCLLIAQSDTGRVLAWQWAAQETTAAWQALLEKVEAPGVVVSDGGSGFPTALKRVWPETKHQRCLFHLQRNITRHLTMRPKLAAGKALRRLVMGLSDVTEAEEAIAWQVKLEAWWQSFGHLTEERTMLRNGQFGFTHARLRKAWKLVRLLVRTDVLFTYITYGNPRTTSRLEGLNGQIREVLRRHRGMPEEHRRRAVEWFLATRDYSISEAIGFAEKVQPIKAKSRPDDQVSKVVYDTGLSAEEGLWARSGQVR